MTDYDKSRINELAKPFGLDLNSLAEIFPFRHYGPGGCDGIDEAETLEQILALCARLVNAERDRCAAIAAARYVDWGAAPVLLTLKQIAELFRAVEAEIKSGEPVREHTVKGIPYYGDADFPKELLNSPITKPEGAT